MVQMFYQKHHYLRMTKFWILFKGFAKHDFMAATVFSKLYIIAAKIFSILAMQILVHLQTGIWNRTSRNLSSTKKEIKFKKFINNFRMFYPCVTSCRLY